MSEWAWHWPKIFSESIATFIITFSFLVVFTIVRSKMFGLDTKTKQRTFGCVASFVIILVGTNAGLAFTSSHAWANPTFAIGQWMAAGIASATDKGRNVSTIYYGVQTNIAVILVGIITGIVFYLSLMMWNNCSKVKIEIKKVFTYDEHSILQNGLIGLLIGSLGLMALYLGSSDIKANASFIRQIVNGVFYVGLFFIFLEQGAVIFNPAIWLGMIVSKIFVQRKFTFKQISSELTIPFASAIGGFTVGWFIFGINKIPA